MRVRRTTSSSLRTAALSAIAALTVTLGIVAVPVAASAVAPIIIDDFSGTVTGTRTIDVTNPTLPGGVASFAESGGIGIAKTYTPNGGSPTGVSLNYAFGTALDLTSGGNNTQFMVGMESVSRTVSGGVPDSSNAVSASIQVSDSHGTTGVYSTGYQDVTNFNQIMNFECSSGGACFSPSNIDFTQVTSIKVQFWSPRNTSPNVTTIRMTEIRTTPTGGVQPGAPQIAITPVGATSPRWIEGSGQLSWDVAITSDGQPASLLTVPGVTSFQVETTGSASAGPLSVAMTGNGTYRYTSTVTGTGTMALRAPAGIAVDHWAQSNAAAVSAPVTLAQGTAPTVAPLSASGVVGVAFSQQISATGTPTPTFSITSGALPSGVTLNTSSGFISGTPTVSGTFPVTVTATNVLGTSAASVTLTIAAIAFTTQPSVAFQLNTPADFTARWTGPANTPVTLTGDLPAGITTTEGDNSLHFTGTPTEDGRFLPVLTLPGGVSQTLTIDVNSAPVITGPSSIITAQGAPTSATYTVTGWPTPTIDISGSLPPGFASSVSGTTLTIEGSATQTGTFPFDVRGTNSTQQTLHPVTVEVGRPAQIVDAPTSIAAAVGEQTVVPLDVIGSPAPTVTLTSGGSLPDWISLEQTDGGEWQIVAEPTAMAPNVGLTLTASNVLGGSVRAITVRTYVRATIDGPASITALVGDAVTDVAYTITGTPQPAPDTQVTVSGDLHGLQVTQDAGSVTFSGTPDAAGISTITINAKQYGVTTTREIVLTVNQRPTIDVGAPISGAVDGSVDRELLLTGFPAPTVTATGLPTGLSIVTDANGTWLRGTLDESGSFTAAITATNEVGSASQQLALTVTRPTTITSPTAVEFPTETDSSFTVTTEGYPVATIFALGLPAGVNLVDNHDGTATLSGRPVATGVTVITIIATGSTSAMQPLLFTATQKPVITVADSYDLPVGVPVDIEVSAIGYPTPTLLVAGLPDGLTFIPSLGTGHIIGTPTTPGVTDMVVTAISPSGLSTRPVELTVGSAPVIAGPTTLRSRVDTAFSADFVVAGFPAPTLTSTPLPDGLSLTRVNDTLWRISGTPTETGVTAMVLHAENGFAPGWDYPVTITIDSVPTFTSADTAAFALGESGTHTVTTSGFPAAQITASALPAGLSFIPANDGTATITGTPTESGEFLVDLTATNATEPVTQTLRITVTEPAAVVDPADIRFRAGVDDDVTITATGFPVPTLTATGVPDELTFVDNGDGTATLSGTPARGGLSDLVVTATNSFGPVSRTIPVTITESPSFTSDDSATVGVDFRIPITAAGYPLPTVTATNLPAGVTLVEDADGVALVGTGATGGVSSIDLVADAEIDGAPVQATQTFHLTVEEAPRITSALTLDTHVGDAVSFPVTTTGYPAPAVSVSDLPDGLTFTDNNDGTGLISGSATNGEATTIVVTAENVRGDDVVNVIATVTEDPAITSADSATVGADFIVPVTVDGFPVPQLTADSLPMGVELTAVDGATALVGTDVRGGEYELALHAENSVGTVDQTFTLTVQEAPAFTSADDLVSPVGESVAFTVSTTGFPTATITAADLPDGLTLTDNGDGTALISGTAIERGATVTMLTATNEVDAALQSLRITVTSPTEFTSAPDADFREGEEGAFTVRTDGFPVALLTLSGSLPAGLSFVDAGDGTATISGTPAESGSFPVTVTATPSAVPTSGVLRSLLAAVMARAAAQDDAVQQELVITVAERVTPTPSPTDSGTPTATPTDPGTPTATPTDPGTPTATPTDPGTPTATPTDPGTPTATPTAGPSSPAPTRTVPAAPATHLPSTGIESPTGAGFAIVALLGGLALIVLARRRTRRG